MPRQVHACLEATVTYSEAPATYLYDSGRQVSLVNPAAIKAFAAAQLSRTKTDKADAELIARYCLTQRPRLWRPAPPEVRELQALVRRLEALTGMRAAEVNWLSAGIASDAVRASVEEMIGHLDEQIRRAGHLTHGHVNSRPGLREHSELPDSIPGVGETTAAVLLTEVPDIKQYR